MRLISLNFGDFWKFHDHVVNFGDGLILVTGQNGVGKTAMAIDAMAWTLWGKTVRGTLCAGDVTATVAAPDGAVYQVHRVRNGRALVSLQLDNVAGPAQPMTGQTPTETQAKIDALFGSWERHQATRVFSVRLAARFGSATDKERKGLLESILGLERFEEAAKVARQVLSDRRLSQQQADQTRAAAEAEVSQAERLLGKLPPAEVSVSEAEAAAERGQRAADKVRAAYQKLSVEHLRLRRAEDAARKLLQEQTDEGRAILRQIEDIELGLKDVHARCVAAKQRSTCPMCFRKTDELSQGLADAMERDARAEQEPKLAELRAKLTPIQAEAVAAKEDLEAIRTRNTQVAASMGEAADLASRCLDDASRDARVLDAVRARAAQEARILDELGAARGRLQEAMEAAQAAGVAVAVAQAACEALGSRGARTRMLASSLAEVGVQANQVLDRVGCDVRVRLGDQRAQASGKVVDEVSIVIEGAGGGQYDGLSDGEKARVDLALLMGLAAVAGERGGLIAFDEVFDPLDDAGLDGVSGLIEEMARERQVLVVTHSPRFTGIVTADERMQVVGTPDGSKVIAA